MKDESEVIMKDNDVDLYFEWSMLLLSKMERRRLFDL